MAFSVHREGVRGGERGYMAAPLTSEEARKQARAAKGVAVYPPQGLSTRRARLVAREHGTGAAALS
jgi:hypothetical protein